MSAICRPNQIELGRKKNMLFLPFSWPFSLKFVLSWLRFLSVLIVDFYTLELSDDDDLPKPNHQKNIECKNVMQQLKQYQYRSALIKQQKHVLGYKPLRRLNECIDIWMLLYKTNRLEFEYWKTQSNLVAGSFSLSFFFALKFWPLPKVTYLQPSGIRPVTD